MALSHSEQIERFGMPIEQAREVLARAAKSEHVEAARAAWQKLAYELQGNKGHPFLCPRHPEAVRFKLVSEIADGKSVAAAVDAARTFAWSEA